jgi:NAD(P)-dependent dehydrogenase (short-subunit alcohol dehydrogenase family)
MSVALPTLPPTLASFDPGLRALVFGAGGALGGEFVRQLAAHPRVAQVYAAARRPQDLPDFGAPAGRVAPLRFELEDEPSIAAAVAAAAADGPLDLVLVATGVLHDGARLQPEKSWRSLTPDALAQAFAVNATGPALIAKHALERLATGRRAVFAALSARVGSIEDNRLGGWHAYRASKAALHMLVRGFAIELARRNPTALCVALHPGTVDSRLSKPFQSGVPSGRLFTPAQSAQALLGVIDRLGSADSGRAFAWDGKPLPF